MLHSPTIPFNLHDVVRIILQNTLVIMKFSLLLIPCDL